MVAPATATTRAAPEAYLAPTSRRSSSARLDLAARRQLQHRGLLSFDVLVTLARWPSWSTSPRSSRQGGGRTILSVSLVLTLSGAAWRARGRASFSILFFDVSFGFDVTIGDDVPPALPAPVDVARLLLAALADARAWSVPLPAGGAALVTLRALEPGTAVLAHPLATLQVRQRVVPLERTLDRFGTSVPSGARRFRITLATIGGVRTTLTALQDRFAPAQFTALSDDAKLSAPSFEEMTSGAALGADGYATGAAVNVSVVYEQLLVDRAGRRAAEVPARGDLRRRLRHADRDAARAPARLRHARGRVSSPPLAAYTFLPWVQGGIERSIAAARRAGCPADRPRDATGDGARGWRRRRAGDGPAVRARRRDRARPRPDRALRSCRLAPPASRPATCRRSQFARADLPWLFTPAVPGTAKTRLRP